MFAVMTRHTTFRLCLDPTVEQREVLARHTGAARFAFNQCLAMVKTALTQRRADPDTEVSWTGFDLINAFNGWKKTEDAGRVFTVDTAGVAEVVVTGLRWRREVSARLARHHQHAANVRRHFLHRVSSELVKTHDRLVIEDLNVSGMLANHRLARAISDASWAGFARILRYKQAWRSGRLTIADRWYPSSKLCPACGAIHGDLTLADRQFSCGCGHSADRDRNAAVNLARWGQAHHEHHIDPRTPKQRGRVTNARRRDGTDQHPSVPVKPARKTREPTFTPHRRPEPTTPEKGGVEHPTELFDTL
jgi:IS605 OrfB family transposase